MLDTSSPFATPRRRPGAEARLDVATRRLRKAIVTCELTPGEFIHEAALAERFGLGRASVRVALTELAAARFVSRHARQGWRIAPIDGALIAAVRGWPPSTGGLAGDASAGRASAFRARSCCSAWCDPVSGRSEPAALATARAAERQLRDLLAAGAGAFVRDWLGEIWDHADRIVRTLDLAGHPIVPADLGDLVAALVAGDAEAAAQAIARGQPAFRRRARAWLPGDLRAAVAPAGPFGPPAQRAPAGRHRSRSADPPHEGAAVMTIAWRTYPLAAACAAVLALAASRPAQASKERFVVDLVNEPSSLDPQVQWNPDSYYVYRNIFDNLVTRDDKGEIVPQVATSLEVPLRHRDRVRASPRHHLPRRLEADGRRRRLQRQAHHRSKASAARSSASSTRSPTRPRSRPDQGQADHGRRLSGPARAARQALDRAEGDRRGASARTPST